LCLLSWDLQAFHYLTPQEVPVERTFAKLTWGIGFSRARGSFKAQPEDDWCP